MSACVEIEKQAENVLILMLMVLGLNILFNSRTTTGLAAKMLSIFRLVQHGSGLPPATQRVLEA